MSASRSDLDQLCINTIRTLAMDAVQKANSGHPGTPMALAPVAYCLWQRHLRYDPADPLWPARDRFVLSAGHASMLLYSLLHLSGVKEVAENGRIMQSPSVSLDDIKAFRQLDSSCPGHPEYGLTSGVEITTGPLGQGVAASVGMAIAGRWYAAHFDRPGFEMFGFDVFVIASDGDLMEGVASEAASLAGHLALSNLCWIYDRNGVTIDGSTDLSFTEDVALRFEACGWHVLSVDDANDLEKLDRAFATFRTVDDRPTLIIVDSHMAYGAPTKQDSSEAHGAPLGEEEVRLTKRAYGWPEDETFLVPEGVRGHFLAGIGRRGVDLTSDWAAAHEQYRTAYPDLASDFELVQERGLPDGWDKGLPVFAPSETGFATRAASGKVLDQLGRNISWLLGGSADLAGSTKAQLTFEGAGELSAENREGRNIHFGVREHAMCAILNGLSLCNLRPFGGTFLVFSDYARPAIRLAALMKLQTIYIFSHDSISLGEDGPTHQPIEQLVSLRAVPGLIVLRPADANEVTDAWRVAMELRDAPAAIVLSRQKLPVLDRARYCAAQVGRGAYVLADADEGEPDVILIGTGSEVELCVAAHERLKLQGVRSRVVSMPSWELFETQSREYRDSVLPPAISARVTLEEGAKLGWERYAGPKGAIIGMEGFGASAPGRDVEAAFGFTVDAVVEAAEDQIRSRNE
jgi:transketolase